jgi:hypothetical protein
MRDCAFFPEGKMGRSPGFSGIVREVKLFINRIFLNNIIYLRMTVDRHSLKKLAKHQLTGEITEAHRMIYQIKEQGE